MKDINRALDSLRYEIEGFGLYRAGRCGPLGHQWGPVMRDLFLSATIMNDGKLLEETFRFACHTQGNQYDPITGEEPGRILHEWESIDIRGLSTKFNSCDSTLLFLIATSLLPRTLLQKNSAHIAMAKGWLLRHIDSNGLFFENPKLCNAERYALKSTYWKDCGLAKRRKIAYPVSFFLTQSQALRALRTVGAEWEIINRAKHALHDKLWPVRLPYIAVDAKAPIAGISSDFLHSLYYLEPEDMPDGKKEIMKSIAEELKTPVGFRTYAPSEQGYRPKAYHFGSIWPFEQYFIAEGARKHGLESVARIADSCSGFSKFPELVDWRNGRIVNLEHKLQLWTVAYKLRKGGTRHE